MQREESRRTREEGLFGKRGFRDRVLDEIPLGMILQNWSEIRFPISVQGLFVDPTILHFP